jgi:hypothetical protein
MLKYQDVNVFIGDLRSINFAIRPAGRRDGPGEPPSQAPAAQYSMRVRLEGRHDQAEMSHDPLCCVFWISLWALANGFQSPPAPRIW